MKRTLLTVLLGAAALPAFAQSNAISIWGTVNIGYRLSSDNVDSSVGNRSSIDSGTHLPTRIGFTGVEDLGNGLKAGFTLETAINSDTGAEAGGSLFSRQAFLSLSGAFGQFAAGRQYVPSYLLTSGIDPFGDLTIGHYNNVYQTEFRWNNQVTYTSPDLAGFSFSAAYTLNAYGQESVENKSAAGDIRAFSITPQYRNGPLNVGANIQQLRKRASGSGNGDKIKIYDLGASYDFGAVKLAALYGVRRTDTTDFSPDSFYDNIDSSGINHSNAGKDSRQWLIGATIPISRSDNLLLSWVQRTTEVAAGNSPDAKSRQFAIGYEHLFSKRTRAYATLAFIDNNRVAKESGLYASTGAAYLSGDGYQRGAVVGLRHDF